MKINTTKSAKGQAGVSAVPGGAVREEVRIPAVSGESDVIEVGLNGRMYLIRRGEKVSLPLPLVEVLEHGGIL